MISKSGYSKTWIRRNYHAYLRSDHWAKVKERYWASKMKKTCEVCGTRHGLQLHHKSYNRVGEERLHDLVPLCGPCHCAVHESIKRRQVEVRRRYKIARVVNSGFVGRHQEGKEVL